MAKFRKNHTSAAKLDSMKVLRIRQLYHEEGWTQSKLSREFGVGSGQIGRIVRNEAWQEYSQIGTTESEVLHTMAKNAGRDWEAESAASLLKLQARLANDVISSPPVPPETHGFVSPGLQRLDEELEKLSPKANSELDDFLNTKEN